MDRTSLLTGTVLLVAALVFGCSKPPTARYPSWEPTSAVVPVVTDRAVALADLALSRKIWHERNLTSYSYVRARMVSEDEIHFTFLVVDRGQVVQRALLASSADETGLGAPAARNRGKTPELLWRERGREVGSHREGAPALTVDQLYEICREQVLSVERDATPRLYFHRSGLLQHCGFLAEECPDCPVASIQSIGRYLPRPWQTPKDVLCTDHYGLFVAGENAPSGGDCEMCDCHPRHQEDPRAGMQAPRVLSPEHCDLDFEDCPEKEGRLEDICAIDPAACPVPRDLPEGAHWLCKWLLHADCGGKPGFYPTPACMGKKSPREPNAEFWKRCYPHGH